MIGSKFFRYFIVITVFFAASNVARGGHIAGGTLSYECVGDEEYLVTLSLFRNCSESTTLTPTQLIKVSSDCGHLFSVVATEIYSAEVSQLCPSALANSACSGGPWPGMMVSKYQVTITLEPCNDWQIYWELCTRSVTVNVDDTVLPCYRINATLNNLEAPCNNSPHVTQESIPYVCVNQPVNFNAGINELDGDSLRYYLVPGLSNGGGQIPYEPGFSGLQPLPGISIGNNTGQVSFTPTSTGNYTVVIEVEEYNDAGILIGTIRHDFIFVVEACPQPVPQPGAGGFSSFSGNGTLVEGNVIQVCGGDEFCAEVEFSSVNASSIITLTSNVETLMPGATFTTTGTNPVVAEVCWEVPPGFSTTIPLTITAQDDACPVFGVAYWGFLVTPSVGVYGGPDVVICEGESVQLEASGDTDYYWQVFSGDPIDEGVNFSCTDCPDPLVTPAVSTVYLVTGLNNTTECIATDTVVVGISLQDISVETTSESCFLNDAAIQLDIPYGSGNYSFLWETGDTTQNMYNIPAGTYNVNIEDLDLGCSLNTDINVEFPPFPATFAGDDDVSCGTTYVMQADSSAASGYWLAPDAADATFFPDIHTHNAEVIVVNNGTWQFYWVEDDGNSCTGIDSVSITFTNPPPIEVEEDNGICGLTYQLSATPPGIGSAFWSAGPGVSFEPDEFDPEAIVTVPDYGLHYITWNLDVGNECGGADSVAITFEEPVIANGGVSVDSVCGMEYQLQAISVGSYRYWSSNSTSLEFSPDIHDPNAIVTADSPGTYSIFWTVETEYCQDIDSLQITFLEPPTANAGSDDVVCGPDYEFSVVPSVGEGHWQGPAGAVFSSGDSLPDAVVSVPAYGNFSFIWVEDNGFTCVDSDTVSVLFVEQPQADAGPDESVCGMNFGMLAVPSAGEGTWTVDTGVTITDEHDPNTAVVADLQGSYTFTWTEDNGNGCISSDEVVVSFGGQPMADAGENQQVCGLSADLDAQPSWSSGLWSPAAGINFVTTPDNPDAEITADVAGIYELWWVEDGGFGCIDSASVEIEFVAYSEPVAGSDTVVCGLDYQLSALPAVGSGHWSIPAGMDISDFADPSADISVLSAGIYTLFWVDVNGFCTDSSSVEVEFVTNPVADAGSDETICGLEYSLLAQSNTGSGAWLPVAGLSFSDINNPNAIVTADNFGTYTLTWQAFGGDACTDSDEVEITFVEAPVANAGGNEVVCGPEFTFQAVPSGGDGSWSGPAGAVFSDPASPVSTVTVAEYGSYIFTWTENTSFGCNASDNVVIEFLEQPVAEAGTDTVICGMIYGLQAVPSVGEGLWTSANGAVEFFPNTAHPEATIEAPSPGVYSFNWVETNGICESLDVLVVEFVEEPVADAGADDAVCGLNYPLNAGNENGAWTGPASAVFSPSPSDPAATVTVPGFGEYTFNWLVDNGNNCSDNDEVTIAFYDTPSVSGVSATCIDGNLNYYVSFTINGGDSTSYQVDGPGTLTGNVFTSEPITNGATYNFDVQDAHGCEVITVSGSNVCDNLTYAGTMNAAPIAACGNNVITAVHNANHTLDGNDALVFVLHSNPSLPLGTIYSENAAPDFNIMPGMSYGTTYYISAVVGNDNGTGGVDFSDPLLSVAEGTPVVFYETPSASVVGGGAACEGDTLWAEVNFTGDPEFNLTYIFNDVVQDVVSASTSTMQLPLTESGLLQLVQVENEYCSAMVSGSVSADFAPLPQGAISGGGEVCDGESEELTVALSGNGPFSFTYAIDGDPQPEIFTGLTLYSLLAADEGTYTLVEVEDETCLGETEGEAILDIIPIPVANAGDDQEICFFGEAVSIGGPPEASTTYSWSNSEFLTNAAISDPQVIYDGEVEDPVVLQFELQAERSGCVATDTVIVSLFPVPEITTNDSVSMCTGGMAQLHVSGASDILWLPDVYIDDHTASDPIVNPPVDQLYEVSVSNTYGCAATGSVFVTVHPTPEVNFTANKDTACVPAVVSFQNLSSSAGAGSCFWDFGNGAYSNSCSPQVSTYYLNQGLFDVSLTITSDYGCSFTKTQFGMINTIGPTAHFNYFPDPADVSNSEISFQNESQNAQVYLWDFGEYGSSMETNPIVEFPHETPGEYEVCLTAMDADGCWDEYCEVVPVAADILVYIPNAFSPNGDGVNDLFHPVMQGVDIVEYDFRIFNRRGQEVWSTTDLADKWDGTDDTREFLDDNQIYSWSLRIKDRYSSLRVDRTGQVMVIR